MATLLIATASAHAAVVITEVHPSGSGNAPYAADFFEIKNTGPGVVSLDGWKVDDSSNAFATAISLRGVSALAPGESAIFLETATDVTTASAFRTAWYGSANAPITIGFYNGTGIGLSAGGDSVVLFNGVGTVVTGVNFGASTSNVTFDNTAGAGSATTPYPTISALSTAGVNGAFTSAGTPSEVGSPIPEPAALAMIGLAGVGLLRRRR
ncbi:MAG TPA: lamin tail domain-containing protein [Tepidisphaeraceae bacterium]